MHQTVMNKFFGSVHEAINNIILLNAPEHIMHKNSWEGGNTHLTKGANKGFTQCCKDKETCQASEVLVG